MSFEPGMAQSANEVKSMVVGQNEDDVSAGRLGANSRRGEGGCGRAFEEMTAEHTMMIS